MRLQDELHEYFERQTPLSSLVCPPLAERFEGHYQELLAIFQQYYIDVTEEDQHTILKFPSGTYKKTLYPLVTIERYRIFIPGGLHFYQTYTPSGIVVLLVPLQFFPQATQEKYEDQ